MSEPILKSYTVKKQDSIDTFLHEWQSIRQSQQEATGETDDELQEKEEQGLYTNSDAIWLEKLGFGSYVTQLQTGDGGEGAEDDLLTNAGLNKHYTHAIRQRMNTLRSTVRSNRKERGGRGGEGQEKGAEDTGDVSMSHRSRKSAMSPSHISSKVSNMLRSSSPSRSPRGSPNLRRGQNSYDVCASAEKFSRRQKNGDYKKNGDHKIDSGIYSASSSCDVTPVRGPQQMLGEGGMAVDRQKVANGSPKHRSAQYPCSAEQNSLPGNRNGQYCEKGEGVYLDDSPTRSRIDPVSLSLVSKSIDNCKPPQHLSEPPQHLPLNTSRSVTGLSSQARGAGVEVVVVEASPRVKRSASERPGVRETEGKGGGLKRETKSMTHLRKDDLRTPSPVQEELPSPQDVKLAFGSVSHANGTVNLGPDGLQDLPNFVISPDALGITTVTDLSQQDMEKVRSVALLELTIMFDDHDIPLRSRRPAKAKSYPENALRGVPLSVLLQADQKREPKASIPLLFDAIISHLETHALEQEGLLRIPGNAARVNSLLQTLEESFQFGQFSFSGLNTNDVCSILKQFIRELPVPLLTREYLPAFASIADISGLKEQVRTLNLLILLLPGVHQRVLKRLLVLFEKIAQHSASNKMDLTNIAMVMAPNLFIRLPTRQNMDQIAMATKTSHLVRLLIKYHHLLWTIPGEMLRQIRYLYENEVRRLNPRSVQKAIKQMQHQLMEQQPSRGITEVSHHIIRVKAPLFTRVCMAVDICVGVTAGDIITKLQKKSRLNQDVIRKRFSSPSLLTESYPMIENANRLRPPEEVVKAGEQFLFEVGGNIGERCLPNNTDMYSLYGVNPNAQWVIKPRDCPDL